jgi:formylglycine-generating enzyme required for sulfatase activity
MTKPIFVFLLIISAIQLPAQKAGELTKVTIPGSKIDFPMAFVPAGSLLFKDPSEKTQNISLGAFWMGVYEVRYDEFILFQFRKNDTNASDWKGSNFSADAVTRPTQQYVDLTFGMGTKGGVPSVSMTQQGALRYCQWLYQKTGQFYRLPTEAEWEYACKAGVTSSLPEGVSTEKIGEVAWYFDNSFEKYHPAGQKKPNAWGFYDMLGNVAEWTLDFYVEDYLQQVGTNPVDPWIKPTSKHSRTVKGGSFDDNVEDCTCSLRLKSQTRWQQRDPQIPKSKWWNTDSDFLGFRLVRPLKQPTAAEVEAFFKEAIIF